MSRNSGIAKTPEAYAYLRAEMHSTASSDKIDKLLLKHSSLRSCPRVCHDSLSETHLRNTLKYHTQNQVTSLQTTRRLLCCCCWYTMGAASWGIQVICLAKTAAIQSVCNIVSAHEQTAVTDFCSNSADTHNKIDLSHLQGSSLPLCAQTSKWCVSPWANRSDCLAPSLL